MSDGSGGSATFTITPVSTSGASSITSGSGNYKVDSYTLSATNKMIVSSNFSNSITVTGGLTVSSLGIDPTTINVSGLTKTYDGTTNVSGLTLNASSSNFKTGDTVSVTGSGNFANANVGTAKAITITPALTGADAGNYYLTGSGTISTTGTVNQLASVTYTGASGGNWSNSANWAGGATPTLSNVATVIIPTTKTVVYDTTNLTGLTPTSAITDNGTISFTSSSATSFANTVSGTGSIAISGTGVVTLSGANTYSGGTTIASGSSLIVGSTTAWGTGAITSSGGSFGTTGITLPSLTINGPVILTTNITTSGNQTYNGVVLGNQLATLTLSAGSSSSITFGDRVGTYYATYGDFTSRSSNPSINNLVISAGTITLEGDVYTYGTQTYTGAVKIGGNGSNGLTRLLLSEDPSISFSSTVDDVTANTHNLNVKAVTTVGAVPSITFTGAVGSIAPLASLTVATGSQNTSTSSSYGSIDPTIYTGTMSIAGNVTTSVNQSYIAGSIALTGLSGVAQTFTSTGGNITFDTGPTGSGISSSNGSTAVFDLSGGVIAGVGSQVPYSSISRVITTTTVSGGGTNTGSNSSAATTPTNTSSLSVIPPASSNIPNNANSSSSIGSSISSGALMSAVFSMPITYSGFTGTGVEISMSSPLMVKSNTTGNAGTNMVASPIAMAGNSDNSFVTVKVQTPSGMITIESAAGTNGFSFTVPESAIVKPVNTGRDAVKDYGVRAQLSDGSPLPSWLSFNENTNTFTAKQVPENVDSVKIDIQTIVGNKVVGSTTIEINPQKAKKI